MGGLLVQHALEHVWCEPIQDRQHTLLAARLTPVGGATLAAPVLWQRVPLPIINGTRSYWHVYQIGQLDASLFKIDLRTNEWTSLVAVLEQDRVVVDMFMSNGAKVPVDYGYLRRNTDGNLILAVRHLPLTDYMGQSLDSDKLYVRFYANARYDTAGWHLTAPEPAHGLRSAARTVLSMADYTAFMLITDAIATLYTGRGYGLYYSDGRLIAKPVGYTPDYLGKHLSFVWDSTIKEITTYRLADLPQFTSLLDINKRKYLLLRSTAYESIDYYDDNDIYLTVPLGGTQYIGGYLGRLRPATVRQLTHNAYSINKQDVTALQHANPLLANPDVQIMLVVRQGGFERGLQQQHNRIEDLYRLSYPQIVEAMVTPTTVPEWSAATLENSAYAAVMQADIETINTILVESAYGYNAVTRALASPLLPVQTSVAPYVMLPPVLAITDRTTGNGKRGLFYYRDGLLVGYRNDTLREQLHYLPAALNTATVVEAFNASVTYGDSGVRYNTDITSTGLAQYGFRCYVCPVVGGLPSEVWTDITDTDYYYYDPDGTVGNGHIPTLAWDYDALALGNLFPCVKINDRIYYFVAPALTPDYTGVIQFKLQETAVWLGSTVVKDYLLPAGVVDVFMDGYSLIQDLDYYIDGATVTITKRPTTAPADTLIQVRSYGFPLPEHMQPDAPREQDFVRGGILSVNNYYNIRNDRNIRTIVAGELKLREQVRYAESGSGALTTDGRPYAITDYAVAVESYTTRHLVPFRKTALDIDTRVMDYLTPRLHETNVRYPAIVSERWALVSPFCSRIIHLLLDGFLNAGELSLSYSDATVDTWVEPYIALLSVDPCVRVVDLRYVVIYPHQYDYLITLNPDQYRFVEYLIRRFLNNRTDLTPSVIIG